MVDDDLYPLRNSVELSSNQIYTHMLQEKCLRWSFSHFLKNEWSDPKIKWYNPFSNVNPPKVSKITRFASLITTKSFGATANSNGTPLFPEGFQNATFLEAGSTRVLFL